MPSRSRYGGTPDYDLLRLALLEQEQNQRPGRAPSSLSMNAYLGELPDTFEQSREADTLSEMDRRYFQSREDDRKRRGAVDDAKALASVRDFQTRGNVAEETSPSTVRTIRRFGDGDQFTDPDAARSARQIALDDPRAIAATQPKPLTPAQISAADKAKAAAEDKAKGDQESVATRDEIIRLANEIKTSGRLNANVGVVDEWLPTVRGDSKDFQRKVERLRDLLSLEARSKLKGQGAVSDFEGRMLANSQSALSRGTDEGSFISELDRIIEQQQKKTSGVRRYNPATGRVE